MGRTLTHWYFRGWAVFTKSTLLQEPFQLLMLKVERMLKGQVVNVHRNWATINIVGSFKNYPYFTELRLIARPGVFPKWRL